MSTGDQSAYVRAKLAERGTSQGVHFSRDGFDNWAESETPARVGQVEKMPAETQMAKSGGAMTIAQAKQFAKKIGSEIDDYYGGRSTKIVPFSGSAMCGGRSFLGIEVPEIVEKAIEWGEKVLNFALLVEKKLPEIEQAIQEEIIDNEDDPSITAKDREIAKAFLPLIKSLKPYLATLKNIKAFADQIKSALGGSGRRKLHGGATAAENFQKAIQFLQQAYTRIKSYIDFITKYGKFLVQMLKLRPLQPIGNQILEKIQPILTLVGMGRHKAKHYCECSDSDSEEYHGGRRHGGFGIDLTGLPGFEQQKQVGYSDDSAEQYDVVRDPLGIPMRVPRKNQGMIRGSRKVGGRRHGGILPGMMKEETYMAPAKEEMSSNTSKLKLLKQKIMNVKDSTNMSSARKERILEKLENEIEALMSKGGRRVGGRRKPSVAVSDQHVSMFGGKTSFVATTTSSRGPRHLGGRKPSARGEIVKKVMREQGLSLPQASKYVKEHGLY